MIRITAKKDGFRRCGVAHPAQPTEHPDDNFSKQQLVILKAEPMLVVEIVEGGPAKNDKPGKADEVIARIKEAATIEDVDTILGEDKRATVVAAAEARKAELAKPE